MNKTSRNAILVLCILVGASALTPAGQAFWGQVGELFGFIPPPPPPATVQYSSFKWTGVAEDATTSVTGASSRVWYDENGDDVIQYSELGTFSESSGVYTSNLEYPIGLEYDLWVQSYVATYQLTYAKFHMTGQRNDDGSAKSVGNLEHRFTDDSLTWNGFMNGVPFDTTDYNYTLSGNTGTLTAEIVLSAADKGISNQVWEGIDYQKAYGINKDYDYYVRWDAIAEGASDAILISQSSVMAPTFAAFWCTVQDKVDGKPASSSFDLNYNDGTNWFFIKVLGSSFGDLMYNTADSIAPRPFMLVTMGTISAAGTFGATYGVGLWQGCTYENMVSGDWTQSTTLALGTCGDGWAWIA